MKKKRRCGTIVLPHKAVQLNGNKHGQIMSMRLFVCLFGGFVPYRKLELLAFKGIVPWISICVSTGVQSIHICCML